MALVTISYPLFVDHFVNIWNRAVTISWLMDLLIDRKLIRNYSDNQSIWVIVQAKMPNICFFMLPQSEDLLFWAVDWIKQDIWRYHTGLWETVMDIFCYVIDQTPNQCIEKIICLNQ